MATCPECDGELDIDEYDVDKGDLLSCPECGTNLEVVNVSPLEFESAPEDEDDEDEELEEEDLDDEEETDEEEEDTEDWEE
jgi:alpha-aminoadipate carrier protein LysW